MDPSRNQAEHNAVEAFIARWQDTGGKERAHYQLFLAELCQLLALPGPEPAGPDPKENAYVFERRVDIHHADGTVNRGYIDLYRRGHFVLELAAGSKDAAPAERASSATLVSRRPGPDPGSSAKKQTWPKNPTGPNPSHARPTRNRPMDPGTLASHYKRKPEKSVTQIVNALVELGMIRTEESSS